MNNLASQPMYGVVNGVYQCNLNRNQELNDRLYSRNIPSKPLQPSFSMRPTPTKYSLFPIIELNKVDNKVNLNNYETYDTKSTFNPGNSMAPWSGFALNVNDESMLRNQFFALQASDQAAYVPSSDSELYNVKVTAKPMAQPFPELFKTPNLAPFNPNTLDVGNAVFNNCTRVEMLNNCDKCQKN